MAVRVRQVKPSNCFRRLEKLVLPSIFDTSLSSVMMWNLQSYPTTVLNKRTWHFRGQNILWPPTYFQGVKTPSNPRCTPVASMLESMADWSIDTPFCAAMLLVIIPSWRLSGFGNLFFVSYLSLPSTCMN